MRTCFVSIPFGVRSDSLGRAIDFDHLYTEVLRPTVQAARIECRRLDDFEMGAIWHKTLFAAIISSDIVIADVTGGNSNVYYELGIRHALRRGRTILISASGLPLPGNVSIARSLFYEPDAHGRLTGVSADDFRTELTSTMSESWSAINDSPVFEFFPGLHVSLPEELDTAGRRPAPRLLLRTAGTRGASGTSFAAARLSLDSAEATLRAMPEADAGDYLAIVRRFRDLAEWDRVIALCEDASPAIRQSPEILQTLALALNRRGDSGDQERAISIMEQYVAQTGGDSETFGILGRIYKDRYDRAERQDDQAAAAESLEKALFNYRRGFEKNPTDYYTGLNTAMLLLQRGSPADHAELDALVQRLRSVLQGKLENERPDFWDIATDLQLSILARDWLSAGAAGARLASLDAPAWVSETTIRALAAIINAFPNSDDRQHVQVVIESLAAAAEARDV